MIVLPIQTAGGRGPLVLILILEKENLDRMRAGDPFDLQPKTIAKFPHGRPITDLDIVIAYEEDTEILMRFQKERDIEGLIAWLERGRKHEPGEPGPAVPMRKT